MKTWMKRIAVAAAVLAPLAVLAYFALDARGEERLREARETFEREIGPLHGSTPPTADVPAEDNVIEALRDGARLKDELDLEAEDWTALHEVVEAREVREWSAHDVERVEALLQRVDSLVELYRRGASRSHAAFRPEDAASDDFSISAFRGARLLLADAGLALRRDDEAAARESLIAMSRLMEVMEQGPGLMQRIIARAVEDRFLRGVQWMVETPDVSVGTLRSLLDRLPRKSAAAAFRRTIAQEAGYMIRTYETLENERRLDGGPIRDWYMSLPGAIDLDAADMLDSYRELASLAEHPFLEARTTRAEALGGPRRPIPKIIMDLLIPNLYVSIGKLQATAASRQLARHALELRIAALEGRDYPEALPSLEPDPLTGSRPVYEVTDRGARLANPTARELWQEEWGGIPTSRPPPYVWNLPPARG